MERLTQNNFDYCLEMCEPETQLDCAFYMSQTECVCGEAAIYNKLREYENAEQEGRLVVLPCKVGETVWFIRGGWANGILMRRHPHEIVPVPFDPSKMWDFENNQFKPHYHLTRAEAEKAMEVSEDA